jgi:hypothetical protein
LKASLKTRILLRVENKIDAHAIYKSIFSELEKKKLKLFSSFMKITTPKKSKSKIRRSLESKEDSDQVSTMGLNES